MFCIKIAELVVEIDNKDSYIEKICKDYIVQEEGQFRVCAKEEDIQKEVENSPPFGYGYFESVCIHREIAKRILAYDAFVLHGAVLEYQNVGYGFCAKSGVGKTTHIRLWQEAFQSDVRIINGDKPIIRFLNNQFYAYGSPWMGKENLGSNGKVLLKNICFIKRNTNNIIKKIDREQALSLLVHQVLFPKEEEEMNQFLTLFDTFLETIQFYVLECNTKIEAAKLAHAEMGDCLTKEK